MPGTSPAREATGAIVGRDTEIAMLTTALERLDAGVGGCLAFTGEAGIGKTRLLRRLRTLAEDRGLVVLDDLGRAASAGDPAERHRARRAGRLALERRAREGPVVVVLDAVDRAGAGALELAADLARRPPGAPVLVAVGARRLPPSVRGAVTAVALSPLGDHDARRLLGDGLDARARAAMLRDCRGNPRHLTLACEPERGRAAVAAEVAEASPAARAVLRAASLAEASFDLGLLAAAAALEVAVTAAAVDELVDLDLLRADATPGRLTCRDPVVRRAVYASADRRWLRAAHRRADGVLAVRGAAPSARADHVARLVRPGDDAAVRLLAEAGTQHVSTDPATAARWLTSAVSALPEAAAPELRATLHASLAVALGSVGRFAEARDALADAPVHADVARAAARLERMVGTGLARRPAADALDEARALDLTTEAEASTRIEAFVELALAGLDGERDGSAAELLARGHALCRATGQLAWRPYLRCLEAFVATRRGDLREAADLVELAFDAVLPEQEPALGWCLTQRSWLAGLRGDLAVARRAGEQAVALSRRVTGTAWPLAPACASAAAAIAGGAAELARDRLVREAGGGDLRALEPSQRPQACELLTQAELALGRLDDAGRWADRAEAAAVGLGRAGALGHARRAGATVALAQGEAARAAELALDAASTFEGLGWRLEAARARTVAGRSLLETGARAGARTQLRAAYVRFEAEGAMPLREEAARGLRGLGRARQGPRGVLALAPELDLGERDRELCRLVAAGLTNREIGRRLFVSEKTVERRLTRIFRRLGLSSRWELAARVRDRRAGRDPAAISRDPAA
jgi:DNA-binding CsgD family transcriptional regulator